MPITMAHAGSPGLVGGAAFGGSLMRNRRKYGLQAAQFADRAIQRRDQRLKYAIDRRDRLADRQDRIQLSLMGQAAADARQQSANNLRRELAVGDATTRFMLANQADERARLTQKGYAERQEDQQAFLEQQQRQKAQAARDEAVLEGLSSGELELPETAFAELNNLENARVTIATDTTLSPEKRQKAFEEIEARWRAVMRTARPAMSDPAAMRNRELGYFNPATGKFQNEYSKGVITFLGEKPLPRVDTGSEGQTPTDRVRELTQQNTDRVLELTRQNVEKQQKDEETVNVSKARRDAEKLADEENLIKLNLPPRAEINAMLERIKGDRAEGTATRWWQAVEAGDEPLIGDDMTPGRLWRLDKNKIIDLDRTPVLKNTVIQAAREEARLRTYGLSSASIGGRSTLFKKQQPVPGTEAVLDAGSINEGPMFGRASVPTTPQERDKLLKSKRLAAFRRVHADLAADKITTKQAEGYLDLLAEDVHREAQMKRAASKDTGGKAASAETNEEIERLTAAGKGHGPQVQRAIDRITALIRQGKLSKEDIKTVNELRAFLISKDIDLWEAASKPEPMHGTDVDPWRGGRHRW